MISSEPTVGNSENIVEAAEQLNAYVQEAASQGIAAHEVERSILDYALRIGKTAMGMYFRLQGTGDLGPSLTLPNGDVVKRLKDLHTREYVSIFGGFQLHRVVYGSREGQKIEFVPLDTRLLLPEGKFSHLLQDWDQMISTEEPFNKVCSFVETILGLRQHADSLQRMCRHMAQHAESFCWTCEVPPPSEEAEILVETADGKGVPIRRPADAPAIQDHQPRPGPKPDRKKMATLGSVYTVDRNIRTPQEVVDALFRKPDEARPESTRPRPCHKHGYARLFCETDEGEIVDGEAAVFTWIADQVRRRDQDGSKEKVCIMDGQRSLWETKDLVQGDVVTTDILDLLHVTPRLWQAAHVFHTKDSPQAERFVRDRVLRVLQGQTRSVVRGFRRMASTRNLSRSQRADIHRICRYFENNNERMRYDEYLEKGYPIASGVIEGACRHIVKDRLERTGMNWTIPGAQAMLQLRSIYINGQWEEFIKYRIAKETERLHPHRRLIDQVEWALAT
jgi:hypothetical protein